jgi:predicted nucleic acid-binding Zn ribbon protein
MTPAPKTLPKGWVAFVQGKKAQLISELTKDGKYYGQLTLITKPTEAELKAELTKLKISLPE